MRARVPVLVSLLTAVCVLAATAAPAQERAQQVSAQQAPSDKTSPDASPSFAIAVAVPLSGEYAALGKQVLEAAKLAADDAGVRLVSKDTKGTPVGAISAVRELAQDPSVLAVIGPVGRRESRAAAQIAQREGLPLLSLASSGAVNRAGGWVYRLRLTPAEQAIQLAEAARRHLPKQKRAAILFPDSNYGQQAAVAFAERFSQLGGTVSAVASYPEDTTDYRKSLDALVGKRLQVGKGARVGKRRADRDGFVRTRERAKVDFELLFIPDFHHRVSRMLAFLPGAGIQTGAGGEGVAVQMLGLSGWQGSSMKLTGAHAAGAIYTDVYVGASDGGRAEDFSIMFEGKTGRRPVDLDAEVFDAAWLVSRLVQKTTRRFEEADTPPDVAKRRLFLANQLPRSQPASGVSGALRFGEDGQPLRQLGLYQFDIDGVVAPFD